MASWELPHCCGVWLSGVRVRGSSPSGLAMSGDPVLAMGFNSAVLRFRRVHGPQLGDTFAFVKFDHVEISRRLPGLTLAYVAYCAM